METIDLEIPIGAGVPFREAGSEGEGEAVNGQGSACLNPAFLQRSQAEKEEETRICRKGVGLGSGHQMSQLMASSPGKDPCPEETPT